MKPNRIYLICLCFFLYFNSYAQNQSITISNIAVGEDVSDNLIVKLDAANIKDYRIASYYLDDTFISNVYYAPFTFEFDTHDFENGKHELSVKALHENGIIETSNIEIHINNNKPKYNLVIKNVRRFASSNQIPIGGSYIDAPHSLLKKNDKEFDIIHNKGLLRHTRREKYGITTRSSGTQEEPFKSLEWSKYVTDLWDKNGYTNQGLWIMSIYRISDNELLSFVHTESCYNLDIPCKEELKLFTIGLGYSKNNGENWTFLGDIVRPYNYNQPDKNINVGGVGYVVIEGQFQIFFYDYDEKSQRRAGTARADKKKVIEAARKGTSFEWKKYRNGEWKEPGLTGMSDDILSNLDFYNNMHCKATYAPSIDKYLLMTSGARNGNPELYILASSDGLNWELAGTITDHNTDLKISYPFFSSLYSDDVHEVGNEFNIHWARNHAELWGANVTIKINE